MGSTYVQGYDSSTLKSHQSRTAEAQADYLLPHVKATSRILDVGCGPGTITCDFAKYATQGSVIGVDFSDEVLEKAQSEAARRGLQNVSFQVADNHSLPFEDESFDIVHCHAVLVHTANAAEAVKEMGRVCKVGGFVAAREPDWDTCVIHPYSADLEKWKAVQAQMKRNEGAEPNAGRHLAEWAVGSGFAMDNVKVTCNVLSYSGTEDLEWWGPLYANRMNTEFGDRAVSAGLASREDIDKFRASYLDWSKSRIGIWAMMHMRLLAQK